MNSIQKALEETRYDDFNLTQNDIKKPSEKIISRFSKLTEKYRVEEHEEEKIVHKKIKIKTRKEVESSKSRSEEKCILKRSKSYLNFFLKKNI